MQCFDNPVDLHKTNRYLQKLLTFIGGRFSSILDGLTKCFAELRSTYYVVVVKCSPSLTKRRGFSFSTLLPCSSPPLSFSPVASPPAPALIHVTQLSNASIDRFFCDLRWRWRRTFKTVQKYGERKDIAKTILTTLSHVALRLPA